MSAYVSFPSSRSVDLEGNQSRRSINPPPGVTWSPTLSLLFLAARARNMEFAAPAHCMALHCGGNTCHSLVACRRSRRQGSSRQAKPAFEIRVPRTAFGSPQAQGETLLVMPVVRCSAAVRRSGHDKLIYLAASSSTCYFEQSVAVRIRRPV